MITKSRAPRNRTLTLIPEEVAQLKNQITSLEDLKNNKDYLNKTIYGDILQALPLLPEAFADLIIIDPPYNLSKNFNGLNFNARSEADYEKYLESWLPEVCKKLKDNGKRVDAKIDALSLNTNCSVNGRNPYLRRLEMYFGFAKSFIKRISYFE